MGRDALYCDYHFTKKRKEYEPDAERDAIWKPIFWSKFGGNYGFQEWLAKIEVEKCDRFGYCYKHTADPRDGKVWLKDTMIPWMEDFTDGKRRLTGCMYSGQSLSYLIRHPWYEVEDAIKLGGEDPLSLPFKDFLVGCLHTEGYSSLKYSNETQEEMIERKETYRKINNLALSWILCLPERIVNTEDYSIALETLSKYDKNAGEIAKMKGIQKGRKWIPFQIGHGFVQNMMVPGDFDTYIKMHNNQLEEILKARLDLTYASRENIPSFKTRYREISCFGDGFDKCTDLTLGQWLKDNSIDINFAK